MHRSDFPKVAAWAPFHLMVGSAMGEDPVSSAEDFLDGATSVGYQLQLDNKPPVEAYSRPWQTFKMKVRERNVADWTSISIMRHSSRMPMRP